MAITTLLFLSCLFLMGGIITEPSAQDSNEQTGIGDLQTFEFKFDSKYSGIFEDYINILNLTVTLLDKGNEKCMEENERKMKEAIRTVYERQSKRDTRLIISQLDPRLKINRNEILNLTLTMLSKQNDKCLQQNAQNMKESILKFLDPTKRDCKELHDYGVKFDGVYKISPTGNATFRAYCDMSNGGWTVIQRRENGDVSFDHNWEEYAEGFGDLDGDHWLGLRHLYDLMENNPGQIQFTFRMSDTHAYATALYNGFYIENEAANFRIHVSSDARYNTEMQKYVDSQNFFMYHNNMQFSTKDADNDESSENCAQTRGGGFWYNNCLTVKINTNFSNMSIWNHESKYIPVSTSEIKFRRLNLN